jgi:hypothetical protein
VGELLRFGKGRLSVRTAQFFPFEGSGEVTHVEHEHHGRKLEDCQEDYRLVT